jgi:hypothetical protein
MGKKRLSRDQKRKAKLAARAKRAPKSSALAYEGTKYKSDEYVPLVFQTERGIYESYAASNKQMTDRVVEAALEKLVLALRHDTLRPLDEETAGATEAASDEDLVIWSIRRSWLELDLAPRRDDAIGVLRTLLSSINTWSTPSRQSRGYLSFLEGFMKKAGVEMIPVSPDMLPPQETDDAEELLLLGREWHRDDNLAAGQEFQELAEDMIDEGEAAKVAEVCQRLIGETIERPIISKKLVELALKAQRAM